MTTAHTNRPRGATRATFKRFKRFNYYLVVSS